MDKKLPVIIDNRNENTLIHAMEKVLPVCRSLDNATGVFEIGSLLMLEGIWQKLEKIRVLMGDETTRRTRQQLLESLKTASNNSIEFEKERDDALIGLDAIRDAIIKKQLLCKTYLKSKFHAKAYLMEGGPQGIVDFAIVGSSNFTRPGLSKNLELNLFSTDQEHIRGLRDWYNELWAEAEDVNDELLKVIEPHLAEYDPFTIYAKCLYEYFAGKEKLQDDWEKNDSVIYRLLSKYQRDGYHQALSITEKYRGSLICDGVGLGKTFIGLMILERYLHQGKRIVLIIPKSTEESVWKANINRYLRPVYSLELEEQLKIERHTSFGRDGLIPENKLNYYRNRSNVLIIDEAHHFRNHLSNRASILMNIAQNKDIYMLTATPINNSMDDLYHLINYFAQNDPQHFTKIRIQHLRKYFLEIEKRIKKKNPDVDINEVVEDEDILREDHLLQHILIQRSRKYVKESETDKSNIPLFPERQLPRVVNYSLKNVYASLYAELRDAFNKDTPFLTLAIYNQTSYEKNPDKQKQQYQKLVIGLIRTLLLKRLESSFKAFEASVEDLLSKMAHFLMHYDPNMFEQWEGTNRRWWKVVQKHILERLEKNEIGSEDEEEDDLDTITDMYPDVGSDSHDMDRMLKDILEDMRQLTDFLSKIYRRFYIKDKEGEEEDPTKDDKLQKLIQYLKEDEILKNQKVIIFTEFRDTGRYLEEQLTLAGFKDVLEVDSGRNVKNRVDVIKRFAPYYNCSYNGNGNNNDELKRYLKDPINILISTDVMSEGLNLQDASLIINYDLHWNPVRLMQRIGRVDRRLNPDIESLLKRPKDLKHKIFFWNFMAPDELEDLLHLKQRLDGKILRINKMLGIEGALLTPDDPDMALKLFNERYEGKQSTDELMNLERQRIMAESPEVWNSLESLPRRLFTGKEAGAGFTPFIDSDGIEIKSIRSTDRKGVFFCYRMPTVLDMATDNLLEFKNEQFDPFVHVAGEVKWYFFDYEEEKIYEDLNATWPVVRCSKGTKRVVIKGVKELADIRKQVERHIKNTYLKDIQAAIGAKPVLLGWMEIN